MRRSSSTIMLRRSPAIRKTHGTVAGDIDPALLVDGLEAEREQGITIDVAYRYFGTPRRRFIVADTPGHKDYTRNMVTGASTSDLAILLVDAGKGLLEQTRRHAFLCSLLGIRQFVLAVNKMDLIGFDERRFQRYCRILCAIRRPVSRMPYRRHSDVRAARRQCRSREARGCRGIEGLPLLEYLETVAGRRRSRTRRRCGCRCNMSTGRTRVSAAMPEPSHPARCAKAWKSLFRAPACARASRGS